MPRRVRIGLTQPKWIKEIRGTATVGAIHLKLPPERYVGFARSGFEKCRFRQSGNYAVFWAVFDLPENSFGDHRVVKRKPRPDFTGQGLFFGRGGRI